MAHQINHVVIVDVLFPSDTGQGKPPAQMQVEMVQGRIEMRLPDGVRFRVLADDLQAALDNVNFLPALRKNGVGKRFGHPVTGAGND